MAHEDKQVQHNFDYEDTFKQDVYYCIIYITHKCPLMQELFSQWASLTYRQHALLNYVSFYILNKDEMSIFSSIIKGINFWNHVQDTEESEDMIEEDLNSEDEISYDKDN